MENTQRVEHDWIYLGETGRDNLALWECKECRGHTTSNGIRNIPSPRALVAEPENGFVLLYSCTEMRVKHVFGE